MRCSVALLSLLVTAAGTARADRVTSSSISETCSILSCAAPFVDARTFVLAPGNGLIPAYCVGETAAVCTFGVQADDDAPPGFGQSITTHAGQSGATLTIVACNNVSDPAHPQRHCPNTTRLTVITTVSDEGEAGYSSVCLVSLADVVPALRSFLCVDGTLPGASVS